MALSLLLPHLLLLLHRLPPLPQLLRQLSLQFHQQSPRR